MMIKPLGFYVIVEMIEVEETSQGGIILSQTDVAKQQEATDIGYVRAIGPTAFAGYPGCDNEGSKPHQQWGLVIGQKVEYRRFEGKRSAIEGYENHRYIPDSHIIGAAND